MTGEALLLFDGGCDVCRRAVRILRAWDRSRRIFCLPYQSPVAQRLVPDLSLDDLSRAMVFLGPRGRRYVGVDALPRILSLLPGGFPLRIFFDLPILPAFGRRIYRWVADHRHGLGCALRPESAV